MPDTLFHLSSIIILIHYCFSPVVRENPAEAMLLQPKPKKDLKDSIREELFTLENNILDNLVKNLSQDFTKQLRDDANLLKQSNSGSSSRTGSGVDKTPETEEAVSNVNEVEHRLDQKSPLHVLLYGRSNHRLDSYSVLNNKNQVFFPLISKHPVICGKLTYLYSLHKVF